MHSTSSARTPTVSSDQTRRRLLRGVAWAAPTVTIGGVAPAVAASAECTPLTTAQLPTAITAFTTSSLAGWTAALTAGSFKTSPVIEYRSEYQPNKSTLANQAVLEADPAVTTVASATLSATPICLAPGTYTFTYAGRSYATNPRAISLDAAVVDAAAPSTVLASAETWTVPANSSTHGSLYRSFTLTLKERRRVTFRYTWTLPASTLTVGNDIGVQAPTLTRTA